MPPRRPEEAGFTLIELIISLGLFALIAVAGVALVDSVMSIQGGTEVRLDRLDELERAMFVVASDLDQVAAGPIVGGGAEIGFRRAAPAFGGPPIAVRYRMRGTTLLREGAGRSQVVARGVTATRWRFYQDGWQDRWPPAGVEGAWPQAVALELRAVATGPAGTLRRVVLLPAVPELPKPAGAETGQPI
jgi:general secretion pathway protein J